MRALLKLSHHHKTSWPGSQLRALSTPSSADRVQALIAKIKKDPAFLKDPRGYVRQWQEKRGSTEEWRIPEDGALQHFLALYGKK